ncbi:hypothetical protein RI138_24105 [Streptomyces sp. C11-1]|uniref:Beta-ketoacyl synthase N-terminal domain-containing protein n=1 Tax=Streptomyces durocortorensis TaxID=2811104 RepID=A0ABY9W3L7_9ACTN|nr:hypothetical protein [Streptomyces durocortorensis]WNF29661.1 hypothetical protein RI138_24105 [Streptomyces durocortorensis]
MFEFNLNQVALCAPDGVTETGEPDGLPEDLYDVIGSTGDQFRDWFTRLCLYLVRTCGELPEGRTDETVVIGTEYGNTAALARLQRDAAAKGRLLSAQYFPNATSSSAAAFVNLTIGATGRNMTLNGGLLTPVTAMWQALSALDRDRSGISRLLVGDVYSPEGLQDAEHDTPGLACDSGVAHATLAKGRDFKAEFDFSAPASDEVGTPAGAHIRVTGVGGAATEATAAATSYGRNGAFVTADFLRAAYALRPAESAVLTCLSPLGRRATVTVTRQKGTTRGHG